jgi:hypothetical protein
MHHPYAYENGFSDSANLVSRSSSFDSEAALLSTSTETQNHLRMAELLSSRHDREVLTAITVDDRGRGYKIRKISTE